MIIVELEHSICVLTKKSFNKCEFLNLNETCFLKFEF